MSMCIEFCDHVSVDRCLAVSLCVHGCYPVELEIYGLISKEKNTWSPKQCPWQQWSVPLYGTVYSRDHLIFNMGSPYLEKNCLYIETGPWSLYCQVISSPDIAYVGCVGPCLTWARISTTCITSIWNNGIKCKHMFMFPLNNLAHKRLNHCGLVMLWIVCGKKPGLHTCSLLVVLCIAFKFEIFSEYMSSGYYSSMYILCILLQ